MEIKLGDSGYYFDEKHYLRYGKITSIANQDYQIIGVINITEIDQSNFFKTKLDALDFITSTLEDCINSTKLEKYTELENKYNINDIVVVSGPNGGRCCYIVGVYRTKNCWRYKYRTYDLSDILTSIIDEEGILCMVRKSDQVPYSDNVIGNEGYYINSRGDMRYGKITSVYFNRTNHCQCETSSGDVIYADDLCTKEDLIDEITKYLDEDFTACDKITVPSNKYDLGDEIVIGNITDNAPYVCVTITKIKLMLGEYNYYFKILDSTLSVREINVICKVPKE